MKVAYSFSTLRYVHDPVTQEFVNVGVAIFSPEAGYFRAICTPSYSRVTRMFGKIDGQGFRHFSRHIQNRICAVGQVYSSASAPEGKLTIERMLAKVLPADDSALQFFKRRRGPERRFGPDVERTARTSGVGACGLAASP
jgi:hypothetical protein